MVEALEKDVLDVGLVSGASGQREHITSNSSYLSRNNNVKYSTFAEMYLEKPIDVQAGISCTICTWRGIPTIDDW